MSRFLLKFLHSFIDSARDPKSPRRIEVKWLGYSFVVLEELAKQTS